MNRKFLWRYCLGLILIPFALNSFGQQKTAQITDKPGVSEKLETVFKKTYKDAENPSWYNLDKNYLVSFTQNRQKSNVLYQKNGTRIYHISYGTEENLPQAVRNLVKSKYFDFNIKTTINVNQHNRNIWFVYVEDAKNINLVRVEDQNLQVVDHSRKS